MDYHITMSYYKTPNEFYLEISKGNVPKHSIVHKFGAGSIGTTVSPVSTTGDYPCPTTAVSLEIVSDSANDTSAGTGAREVTITGINASWAEQTITVATNGTTAVVVSGTWLRVHRWYVSQSGTYATGATYSHAGNLTLRVAGAGATWTTIPTTPIPVGQSQIGCYTIPTGYKGYLLSKSVYTDSSKTADIFFFQRPNANDTTAPYTGTLRLVEREIGVTGGYFHPFASPKPPFVGPCDVGFMAKVATGTADVSVEFELLLVQD